MSLISNGLETAKTQCFQNFLIIWQFESICGLYSQMEETLHTHSLFFLFVISGNICMATITNFIWHSPKIQCFIFSLSSNMIIIWVTKVKYKKKSIIFIFVTMCSYLSICVFLRPRIWYREKASNTLFGVFFFHLLKVLFQVISMKCCKRLKYTGLLSNSHFFGNMGLFSVRHLKQNRDA